MAFFCEKELEKAKKMLPKINDSDKKETKNVR